MLICVSDFFDFILDVINFISLINFVIIKCYQVNQFIQL